MLLFLNFSYVVQNQALMKTHKQLVLSSPMQKIKHNLENRAIHSVSVLPVHLCARSGAKRQEMKVQWNCGKIFLEEAGCCCIYRSEGWLTCVAEPLKFICTTTAITNNGIHNFIVCVSKLVHKWYDRPFFLHFTLFCLVIILQK